jgi:hypothetical protein
MARVPYSKPYDGRKTGDRTGGKDQRMQARGVATGPATQRSVKTKYGDKDILELSILEDSLSEPATLTVWGPTPELSKQLTELKRGAVIAFLVKAVSSYNNRANLEPVDGSIRFA